MEAFVQFNPMSITELDSSLADEIRCHAGLFGICWRNIWRNPA